MKNKKFLLNVYPIFLSFIFFHSPSTSAVERVVTLAPSLGELAADLLGDEIQKIVGVSEFSNYPPRLKKVESIGPYYKFNLEKVVALKPDLILATQDGNPKDQVEHLKEMGLPVVVVSTSTLKEVEESIRLVGISLGLKEKGEKMAHQLHQGLENFKSKTAKKNKKPQVLLQVGDDPLVVAGGKSFLSELIGLLGATNVYGDLQNHYPRPSAEDVLKKNPDHILVLSLDGDRVKSSQMATKWLKFKSLKATENHQIKILLGDTILRPTLRLLEGLSLMEKAIDGKI